MNDAQKNNWLQKLATESWQAELVISGIAIFGSFQLFALVAQLIDYVYFHLPDTVMTAAYFGCFYILIAVIVLSSSFLLHFLVRAIWIAGMGLESVYPHGFKEENDSLSDDFLYKLQQKFPGLGQFNEQLDRLGSAILAHALMLVMMFVGIGTFIFGIIFLSSIVTWRIGPDAGQWTLNIIGGIMAVVVLTNSLFSSKYFRDRPWVQRIHFPISIYGVGTIMGNVFYRPMTYFMFTIRTNVERKHFMMGWAVMMVFLFSGMIFIIDQTNIFGLIDRNYHRYEYSVNRLYSRNYEDQNVEYGEELAFVRPVLPSMIIEDIKTLRLFLPLPERESFLIKSICQIPEIEGDALDINIRERKRQRLVDCYRAHLELQIDDTPLTDYIVKLYSHPHANEPGLLYLFPNLSLTPGEHTLSITHHWAYDKQPKLDRIPFFYYGQ